MCNRGGISYYKKSKEVQEKGTSPSPRCSSTAAGAAAKALNMIFFQTSMSHVSTHHLLPNTNNQSAAHLYFLNLHQLDANIHRSGININIKTPV
jgi:hypothetical protein